MLASVRTVHLPPGASPSAKVGTPISSSLGESPTVATPSPFAPRALSFSTPDLVKVKQEILPMVDVRAIYLQRKAELEALIGDAGDSEA